MVLYTSDPSALSRRQEDLCEFKGSLDEKWVQASQGHTVNPYLKMKTKWNCLEQAK